MPNKLSPGSRCRVIKAYEAEFPVPLAFSKGEMLVVEERETTFPGWLWCTNDRGESRWVPVAFLERDRDGSRARMNRDYDSRELSVEVGETLIVEERVSEWLWCLQEKSRLRGWVPEAHTETIV